MFIGILLILSNKILHSSHSWGRARGRTKWKDPPMGVAGSRQRGTMQQPGMPFRHLSRKSRETRVGFEDAAAGHSTRRPAARRRVGQANGTPLPGAQRRCIFGMGHVTLSAGVSDLAPIVALSPERVFWHQQTNMCACVCVGPVRIRLSLKEWS